MSYININTGDEAKAGEFLANVILIKLKENKKVLWFVTGGSSIKVAHVAGEIIARFPHENLTVMLTDERYGPLNHKDSNWYQLISLGFELPKAKLIPILDENNIELTTEKFDQHLEEELKKADYKIGLFGVGADGHTAGILPNTEAVKSKNFAFGYNTDKFERITITPKTISLLNEIVVFMKGEEKWKVINDLDLKEIDIHLQPAQILKKVPIFTLFTDYSPK